MRSKAEDNEGKRTEEGEPYAWITLYRTYAEGLDEPEEN
jgi:hypothetical protein